MTDTIGRTAADPEDGLDHLHLAEVQPAGPALEAELEDGLRGLPRRRWIRRYVAMLMGADVVAGLVATAAAYLVRPNASLQTHYLGDRVSYPHLAVLLLAAWLVMLAWSGAYRSRHVVSDHRDYRVPVFSALRLVAVLIIGSYVVAASTSRLMILTYAIALIVSTLATRACANGVLWVVRRRGKAQARMLLVGDIRAVRSFADHLLRHPDPGTTIVGVCTTSNAATVQVRGHSLPVVGRPDDLVASAQHLAADAVAVADPSGLESLTLQQATWELERDEIDLFLAPDAVSVAGPRIHVASLRGLPLMHVRHPHHESLVRSVHHLVFRAVGVALAVLALPVCAVVALAVKLDSPGPVFFRQKRVGYRAQSFDMIKFRTMVPDAEGRLADLVELNEHDGALFKMRDDPRVTRVGRLLRKYSLDELPQLINVVKGEMTLVGPRPVLPREVSRFGEDEHRRFMVRPGMTGLWQVSGGPKLPWIDAVRTDLYYVDNWTPGLDLSILGRTVAVVFSGAGL